MKKNTVIWIMILLVFLSIFSFLLAVFWRYIAFKYIFQFITSFGFLIIGFYYFLRASVPGNIGKGLLFIILSPTVFFITNLFFKPIKFRSYNNIW